MSGQRGAPLLTVPGQTVVFLGADARAMTLFAGHLMSALAAAGHQVHAAAPAPDAAERSWFSDRGIAFHTVAMARNTIAPVADLKTTAGLRRLFGAIGPDVVLAAMIKPIVYGLPAARSAGVRRTLGLVTGLGYAFIPQPGDLRWQLIHRAARLLYRRSVRGASGMIFQNPDDRDEFDRLGILGRTPALVVPGSGVDLVRFAPAPLPERPVFLMIGRLLADKGVREFIAAARLVRRQRPDASFHLLGPAETNPSAVPLAEVEAAAADGAIRYFGTTEDVRPAIAEASVMVLPSYREGLPRALLEGMAMGRGVVATDVPGCREVVDEGRNGLLVPPRDSAALATALLRLAGNPAERQRMGEESRRAAEKRFDEAAVTEEIRAFCGL